VAGLYLVRRFGRRTLHAGLAVMATAFTAVALAPAPGTLVPLLFTAGLGMGLVLAPFLSIVLWGVADDEVGSASGLLNTAQQLAGALGIAVLGTIFLALGGAGLAAAFRPVCWLVAGLLVVSFALAFFLPRAKVVK
jgi:MFS family permease